LTPSLTELPQASGSFTFTVSSDVPAGESVTLTIPTITSEGKSITFSGLPSGLVSLTSVPQTITVSYAVESGFNFEFADEYNAVITSTGSAVTTKSVSFAPSAFCSYNNNGDLKTTIRAVNVVEGLGEDNEWYAFDKVEVEVRIENNGDEDLDNVIVEWGLYNTQSKSWTIEITEEDDFNLDSDEKEELVLTIELNDDLDEDLADMEEGDYVIYVKATGEISAGTYDGESTCSSDSEEAKFVVENDFVILNNFEVPETVQCDSEAQISAEVWNVGSDDQEGVYVNVYNKELGVDENVEIGDVDALDNTDFSFILQLPEDAEEKEYDFTLTVYDEDDDVYENGNDDEAVFIATLNVQGSCSAGASVNAVLESGGQAGRDLVVRAVLTNEGSKVSLYSLNIAGYTEWASGVTLDKSSLSLNPGESGDVLLTFDVKKEALGANLFNIEILSEGKLVGLPQPVQVEIAKKGFSLENIFSKDNKYIWAIVALNVLLVVLIIIIAVRISRK
jgi:hypothetical protein